jgi:Leucine Rich repeat
MSTTGPNPPPPGRRRLSIRVPRPLWIGVAAAVVIVVAVGLRVGLPMYREHVAVAEVERLGGWAFTEPWGPEWLASLLYDIDQDLGDRLDTVSSVCLEGRPATDKTLEQLSWLSGLKELRLNQTKITDAGLARLHRLTNLKRIDLAHCPVTDTGVADLQKALPGLTVRR